MRIFVDADACPVKPEAVRVARRYGIELTFVSNSWMRLPEEWGAALKVVDGQFDAADDWIVGHVQKDDIIVTADIPLAHRCIKAGARVIGTHGQLFTDVNIGDILATRDLLHTLRGGRGDRRRPRALPQRGPIVLPAGPRPGHPDHQAERLLTSARPRFRSPAHSLCRRGILWVMQGSRA